MSENESAMPPAITGSTDLGTIVAEALYIGDQRVAQVIFEPVPPPPIPPRPADPIQMPIKEPTLEELRAMLKPVGSDKLVEVPVEAKVGTEKKRDFATFYPVELQTLVRQHPTSELLAGIIRSRYNVSPAKDARPTTSEGWITWLENVELPAVLPKTFSISGRPTPQHRTDFDPDVVEIEVSLSGYDNLIIDATENWSTEFIVTVPGDVLAEGEDAVTEYLEDRDNWPDDWDDNKDYGDMDYGDTRNRESSDDGGPTFSSRAVDSAVETYRNNHPDEEE